VFWGVGYNWTYNLLVSTVCIWYDLLRALFKLVDEVLLGRIVILFWSIRNIISDFFGGCL